MQFWTALYCELAERIKAQLPAVRWVDLWHNQVHFLEEEQAFPSPAVFLGFRSTQMQDQGLKIQHVVLQLDCYLFYETFLDTAQGAYNQSDALAFVETLDYLHAMFHGTDGENYSGMRRVAFAPVDTGGRGNLYQLSFACQLQDCSAMKRFVDGKVKAIEIEKSELQPPDFIL